MNQGLLNQQVWKWYSQHPEQAQAAGLTPEDLQQEGFFAVKDAVARYDPERGAFSTCLAFALQARIQKALLGGSCKLVECADGKTRQVGANPLNGAAELDAPVPGLDDSDLTVLDTIADPAGQAAFEAVDEELYRDAVKEAVEKALLVLADRERAVIRAHYLDKQPRTLKAVGETLGVSTSRAQQIERSAFRTLIRNPELRRCHAELIGARAYQGTGFSAWEYGGSVEERIVEDLDRRGAYASHYERIARRQAQQEQALRQRTEELLRDFDQRLADLCGLPLEEYLRRRERSRAAGEADPPGTSEMDCPPAGGPPG